MQSVLLRQLRWIVPVYLLTIVFSCKKDLTPVQRNLYADPKSLFSLISANFNLSHCDTALILTGLDSLLAGQGALTVFVVQDNNYPTDGMLVSGKITYATGGNFYGKTYNSNNNRPWYNNYYYWYVQQGNLPYLRKVMAAHILPQKLSFAAIPFGLNKAYATLAGDSVYISKYMNPNSPGSDTIVTVNGIRVNRHDFQASNGVYHVLNQLLFPAPNISTWGILSGSNAPGWFFEPTPNNNAYQCSNGNCIIKDTDGFSIPAYNFGTFATALVRTGLHHLLQGSDPYTVLAVPNNYFLNPYDPALPVMSQQQVLSMGLDSLTKIMKLHILPGRYFMSDFQSWSYNPNVLDTLYNPSGGYTTYSKPLAFPTIGSDSLYVIPNGLPPGSNTPGCWLFGPGNLLYSRWQSSLNNRLCIAAQLTWFQIDPYAAQNLTLQPQDVVAPNGVVQYLYQTELVPK